MQDSHYNVLLEHVESAYYDRQALNICGASSKSFYGGSPRGLTLSLTDNQGITDYDPSELVIVARTGTRLADIQSTLASKGQMLGFEPPFAKQGATLGGAIASGLSGAGRPYRGGVRDYLLGTKIINGKAQIAQFGGKVMKNVAGFDLFRPMAGSMGTLGVLLEVSLRVIPIPEQELSLEFDLGKEAQAIKAMCSFGKQLPSLSAASWIEGAARVRLSGSQLAVERDARLLRETYSTREIDALYWASIGELQHEFLNQTDGQHCIAAIDLPPATPPVDFPGQQLIDWGGARRYLKTPLNIEAIRKVADTLGGSATLLQGGDRSACFHPLSSGLMAVHRRIKQSFDPRGILNPDRLYTGL